MLKKSFLLVSNIWTQLSILDYQVKKGNLFKIVLTYEDMTNYKQNK